jgi:hypothetical protein
MSSKKRVANPNKGVKFCGAFCCAENTEYALVFETITISEAREYAVEDCEHCGRRLYPTSKAYCPLKIGPPLPNFVIVAKFRHIGPAWDVTPDKKLAHNHFVELLEALDLAKGSDRVLAKADVDAHIDNLRDCADAEDAEEVAKKIAMTKDARKSRKWAKRHPEKTTEIRGPFEFTYEWRLADQSESEGGSSVNREFWSSVAMTNGAGCVAKNVNDITLIADDFTQLTKETGLSLIQIEKLMPISEHMYNALPEARAYFHGLNPHDGLTYGARVRLTPEAKRDLLSDWYRLPCWVVIVVIMRIALYLCSYLV